MDTIDDEKMEQEFSDFLDSEKSNYKYVINDLIENNNKRISISIDIMRKVSPEMTAKFLSKPLDFIGPFQRVVTRKVSNIKKGLIEKMETNEDEDYDKDLIKQYKDSLDKEVFVGFEGNLGSSHVTPRGLNASLLSRLVCVEGIVTKCSLVRPKIIKSVHYCEKTKKTISRTYADATSDSGIPSSTSYPTRDESGNPLITEYGMCLYKDSQMVSIQEMPERAPAGQLPRSVDILMDNDLVDRVKPGDRVQVFGVYRAIPMSAPELKTTKFRPILICNRILMLSKEVSGPTITAEDVRNIKNFSLHENGFDLLATSLAPSIYGHDYIKKSLLLLLLGGVEQNLPNGTHLRGDINLLMVGDPSTAKSQLLRFILNIAPLAINTTGRGSSGVGLTAAVTNDSETGERRLEAGAMVLADRGIVCIDEFDKMSPDDRVAIHEVMEQQTVTISKAGIHASLNARCSVVAAANPIYGKYNPDLKAHTNIGLPDSLLSRFDLLFIVLDNVNPDHDRMISDHVLRMHRYKDEGAEMETFLQSEQISTLGGELSNGLSKNNSNADIDTPIFQKYNRTLHGNEKSYDIVSIPFIQKYIHYAKTIIKPKLSEDARKYIIEQYTDLRSKQTNNSLPITTRTLETMIRLSQAHAKCRLDRNVTQRDAEVAYEIMNKALSDSNTKEREKERINSNKRKNKKDNEESYNDDEIIDENMKDKLDEEIFDNDNDDNFDINNNNNNNSNNNSKNNSNNKNNKSTNDTTKKRKKTNDNDNTTLKPVSKNNDNKKLNKAIVELLAKGEGKMDKNQLIKSLSDNFSNEEINTTLNNLEQRKLITTIKGIVRSNIQ
ncbi:hypothetical protein DICPUDRAFT_157902 [Dictyostelium purpureum]|uniref:DNA replication licensing factor MCM3 n=1 Tax=Dictyostelium purpureum TaxID=5786 RepID=F1A0B0_DICPU|nr:uncharacterized protein DICPUDRAFT_157902 [Dictyostelium purpureum]EGC30365.1 hypothetical protein DICPUDRAFT_157902 [Dictyostelium purpureum]|eukprot:XP_003293107.1 hypothetical protein DICPUDRAFT_157902 [Dictyostelium purpureum]